MKKASVITLQYVDNFGSVLQTYATQEILKMMGYDSEVVNYTRENCTYDFQRKLALDRYRSMGGILSFYPIAKLLQVRWSIIVKRRTRVFDSFRKNFLNLSRIYFSPQDLIENPPSADVYVTGSDQVWNPEYNGGVLGEYFLNYAPVGAKRIALSASIGMEHIAEPFFEQMAEYIKKYDGISVREQSALQTLSELGYPHAIHVMDPTLMLTEEEWSEHMKLRKTEKPYVLMYQLNDNKKMLDFAAQIANDNGIELIIISSKNKKANCAYKVVKNCSPERFLELIKNAKYVVTDSFHGTAFSFNFNRNVFVFNPPKYSTRLTSILSLFNSAFRLVEDENWKDIEEINFVEVNAVLAAERQKVKRFLLQHLS